MYNVLVTGTSRGIGRAIAERFLDCANVYGFDTEESSIFHSNYHHYIVDVSKPDTYPELPEIHILVNNAGIQQGDVFGVNAKGVINCTERYGVHPNIKSILNIASTSAHNGAEFPEYAASKGSVLAYTKNVAMRVAQYGATCNSISPGGVYTNLNDHILEDPNLTKLVMAESLLGKWATAAEIADWVYFITMVNKSMTAQDIIVDNGEANNYHFIW